MSNQEVYAWLFSVYEIFRDYFDMKLFFLVKTFLVNIFVYILSSNLLINIYITLLEKHLQL